MKNISNLNIYSGLMSVERMIRKTDGEESGQDDGDYLSWGQNELSLHGAAKMNCAEKSPGVHRVFPEAGELIA